jgi:UDP-N-acetylglucosamine 3-dehydrogenase
LKDTVKVGVVGAGYWGRKVISEYLALAKENPKVSLSHICDIQEQNLLYCSKFFHIPKSRLLKSYDELLDLDQIDAVHICTPNNTHYQFCKEALMAGKHVLLEKPMTLSSRQAFELMDLEKKEGLVLQVGYIFRFNNALREARKLIRGKFFGDLYYLRLQWTNLMLPTPKRDIIFDLGPHPVDIINFLLETWPSKVTCKARAYTRKTLPETVYAIVELNTLVMANIELSWLQPGKERRVDVIGAERCATIDCLNQNVDVFQNHGRNSFRVNVQRNNTILTEVKHFVDRISEDVESVNSGLVGPMNVLVLENFRKSITENKTVKIDFRGAFHNHS